MAVVIKNVVENQDGRVGCSTLTATINGKSIVLVLKKDELIFRVGINEHDMDLYYKAIMYWFSKVPNLKHRKYKYDDCIITGDVMELLLQNVKVLKNHNGLVERVDKCLTISCI